MSSSPCAVELDASKVPAQLASREGGSPSLHRWRTDDTGKPAGCRTDRSRQLARLPRDWSGLGKFQGGRRVPIEQVRIAGLPVRRLALRDSIDCRSQLSSRCGVGTPPRSNRGPAAVQQLLPSLLAALASSAVVNVDRLLLEDGGPFAIGASAEPGAHLGCRSLMTFVRCSWAG